MALSGTDELSHCPFFCAGLRVCYFKHWRLGCPSRALWEHDIAIAAGNSLVCGFAAKSCAFPLNSRDKPLHDSLSLIQIFILKDKIYSQRY